MQHRDDSVLNDRSSIGSRAIQFRRREFLRFGLAGFSAMSLPDLLRLRSASGSEKRRRTSIIMVWLPGGASHLETYDPKPDAPAEFRGPYNAIKTSVEGMHISELLPRHAQNAHRFSLLRSVQHSGFCHQQGTQQLLTGHPVLELKQKPDNPDLLAITNLVRHDAQRSLPNYVGVPPINYSGAAYIGPTYEPFGVFGDPSSPEFSVPNVGLTDASLKSKLEQRIDLRQRFDRLQRDLDQAGSMRAFDAFESQAMNLLTSNQTKDAFDLSQESDAIKDRYGRNMWGQRCLLARRLVEAGVEIVTTQFDGSLCGRVGNWDDHAVNHNVFEGMKYRAPFYDQAVSTLIEDLAERGLDRDVLVVTGEFGRTPRISYSPSTGEGIASAPAGTVQPGRDHWPSATSILFAGGGIDPGQVVGATDRRGEGPVDQLVSRGDFLATLYRHLGVDAERIAFNNFSGRPIPILQDGKPIPQLVARG
ncbi:MAG: DUF1501 domain-containing protein [Planctomycetota bacterium]|nr:DUF1501 domain-containing protein [Planctomycetota bacterium]